MADRVDMNPPFGEATVQIAAEAVETYKAAGWTEAKPAARKSADKK